MNNLRIKFLFFAIIYPLVIFAVIQNEERMLIVDSKDQNKGESKFGKVEKNQSQQGTQEAEKSLKMGNLAFPSSQQPSPLVSFGQNIINRKQTEIQFAFSESKGKDQDFKTFNPQMIYAFTDSFSLFMVTSQALHYKQGKYHSSGPEDTVIQLEYAFYTKAYRTYYDQATIVANVSLPTGSAKKKPATGIGSKSFFIGGTYSRMKIDWFYFISSGGILTTTHKGNQFGSQFLYQFGFGRRIANTSEWLLDWMLELDGTYSWKNKMHRMIDSNSGGNIIWLTPSVWISTKKSFFIQFGMGFPIYQYLFGYQKKSTSMLLLNSGWVF